MSGGKNEREMKLKSKRGMQVGCCRLDKIVNTKEIMKYNSG